MLNLITGGYGSTIINGAIDLAKSTPRESLLGTNSTDRNSTPPLRGYTAYALNGDSVSPFSVFSTLYGDMRFDYKYNEF